MTTAPRLTTTQRRRSVPLTLCLQVLFGGKITQMGWSFLGATVLVFWMVVWQSTLFSWVRFIGPLQTAPGIVNTVTDTGTSAGGRRYNHNRKPIYEISYTFQPKGSATPVSGVSYQSVPYNETAIAEGAQVTVEYRASHPQHSRIQGLRSVKFSGWMVLILIPFGLFGLVFAIGPIILGARAIRVLARGVMTTGTLKAVRIDKSDNSDYPEYTLIFSYTPQTGQPAITNFCTTNLKPAWRAFYQRHRAGQAQLQGAEIAEQAAPQEILFYNPRQPDDAFIPAALGNQIRVTSAGYITGDDPLIGVAAAILPSVIVLMQIWFMLR